MLAQPMPTQVLLGQIFEAHLSLAQLVPTQFLIGQLLLTQFSSEQFLPAQLSKVRIIFLSGLDFCEIALSKPVNILSSMEPIYFRILLLLFF